MSRSRADEIRAGTTIALFVTCLVDTVRPSVGRAIVGILETLGLRVTVPDSQTCCGLPFFNNGYRKEAAALARRTVHAMSDVDWILVPSGSCAWLLREVLPELLPEGASFAARVVEFSEVVASFPSWTASARGVTSVTYHPSCHLLRGLGIRDAPKRVLERIAGLNVIPLQQEEECCGFGGSFSVRFPQVSTAMMQDKLVHVGQTGADAVVVTDVGCLLQLDGGLRRRREGHVARVLHLAELLHDECEMKT